MTREPARIVDEVLDAHASDLGDDLTGYRNHVHRVVHFCTALARVDHAALTRIAIAAAFHDLGIWTDHTFDYLEPSVRRAEAFLARSDRVEWRAEIAAMIREHHKLRAYRGPFALVEPFRRADWIDVSLGVRRFGLSASQLRAARQRYPDAGFHRRLVELSLHRAWTHPLNPLPMLRW